MMDGNKKEKVGLWSSFSHFFVVDKSMALVVLSRALSRCRMAPSARFSSDITSVPSWRSEMAAVARTDKRMLFAPLQERSVLVCEGVDIVPLLQTTTTNDMHFLGSKSEEAPHPFNMQSSEKIARQDLLHTCFLNSKGRFLFDAFLFVDRSAPDSPLGNPTRVFIDCESSRADDLMEHLKMRIIRKKVKVSLSLHLFVLIL